MILKVSYSFKVIKNKTQGSFSVTQVGNEQPDVKTISKRKLFLKSAQVTPSGKAAPAESSHIHRLQPSGQLLRPQDTPNKALLQRIWFIFTVFFLVLSSTLLLCSSHYKSPVKASKYTLKAKLSWDPIQQTLNLYEINAFSVGVFCFFFKKQSAEHLSSRYCPGKPSPMKVVSTSHSSLKTTRNEARTSSPPFCSFFTAPEGRSHAQKFPQVFNTHEFPQALAFIPKHSQERGWVTHLSK